MGIIVCSLRFLNSSPHFLHPHVIAADTHSVARLKLPGFLHRIRSLAKSGSFTPKTLAESCKNKKEVTCYFSRSQQHPHNDIRCTPQVSTKKRLAVCTGCFMFQKYSLEQILGLDGRLLGCGNGLTARSARPQRLLHGCPSSPHLPNRPRWSHRRASRSPQPADCRSQCRN